MKFLLLGSGAREHSMAKRLKEEGQEVYSYQIRPNIGLLNLVNKSWLEKNYDLNRIIKISTQNSIDIIVPCNEQAIYAGVKDSSTINGIKCYAPLSLFCLLETDRFFAKQLVMDFDQQLLIPFKVINSYTCLKNFISQY